MSDTELDLAVAGFRRAEEALAAITTDAQMLAEAGAEAAEARDALVTAGQDLKVVAGALVGLASAHQELVAQLGSAAAALRPPAALERADAGPSDENVLIALSESNAERAQQASDLLAAVEELSRRVDAAVDERIGTALERLSTGLPTAADIAALSAKLDGLVPQSPTTPATSTELDVVVARLDEMSGKIDGIKPGQGLDVIVKDLKRLAGKDGLAALDKRVAELVKAGKDLSGAQAALEGMDPAIIVGRVDGATGRRIDDLERRLVASQRRIYELVLVEGLAFLVLAAVLAFLALR